MTLQLETCKQDLEKVEKERNVAMSYRTEVEALKSKLSAKEKEVLELSSELQKLEGELQLQDEAGDGSSPSEVNCHKRSSKSFGTLGLVIRFYEGIQAASIRCCRMVSLLHKRWFSFLHSRRRHGKIICWCGFDMSQL